MNRYADVVDHFGVANQCKKLNEESYELVEAILMYETTLANDDSDYRKHITEELSDVVLLIIEFMNYYKISVEEIDSFVEYKINRTEERIKSGYYNDKH